MLDASPTPRPAPAPAELDAATLRRAQRGDREAQAALVATYQKPVWALVWRLLGRRAQLAIAQDLTQDALLKVLQALPGYAPRPGKRPSAWILTIAARTTIDHLRRKPLELLRADTNAGHAPMAYRPDWQGERASLGQAIAAAVEALSPDIRATFLLRAYHELSYDEIAEALEVDLGTVKSRISRARKALRDQLQEAHHDFA